MNSSGADERWPQRWLAGERPTEVLWFDHVCAYASGLDALTSIELEAATRLQESVSSRQRHNPDTSGRARASQLPHDLAGRPDHRPTGSDPSHKAESRPRPKPPG